MTKIAKDILDVMIPEMRRRRAPKTGKSKYYGVIKAKAPSKWNASLSLKSTSGGTGNEYAPTFTLGAFNDEHKAARWISMVLLVYLGQGKKNRMLLNGHSLKSLCDWHKACLDGDPSVEAEKLPDGSYTFVCGRCSKTTTLFSTSKKYRCGCCGSKFFYDKPADTWTSDFECWTQRFAKRSVIELRTGAGTPRPRLDTPVQPGNLVEHCDDTRRCKMYLEIEEVVKRQSAEITELTLEDAAKQTRVNELLGLNQQLREDNIESARAVMDLREKLKARDESIKNLARELDIVIKRRNAIVAEFEDAKKRNADISPVNTALTDSIADTLETLADDIYEAKKRTGKMVPQNRVFETILSAMRDLRNLNNEFAGLS